MTSRERFIIADELPLAEQDLAWAAEQQAAFEEAARVSVAWQMGAHGTAEVVQKAA